MAKCLGLYIEDNIIKYAKVSKEREDIKVEAFGMEFYEKLDKAIDKIVEETYSQKTPISINLVGENYNFFRVFSLLSKNDLQKAIKTEFETYCEENGYSPSVFETRYAVVDQKDEKDKFKIIYVSENKIEMSKTTQQLSGHRISAIAPIPMILPNLLGLNDDIVEKENALIVNIEENATITTIIDNKIQHVDLLEEGSADFLNKLNLKENSYAKAYDICKNTTIYTTAGKELQTTQDPAYIDDIMPTLYSIVSTVKKQITDSVEKIKKVYITGTGAMINNIDIYFQEYLDEVECEVLRPYFIQNTGDISIKDYEEVNTAISLALLGLGEGLTGMNFKAKSLSDGVPDWLKMDIGSGAITNALSSKNNDLGEPYDKTELILLRVAIGMFLLVVIYSGFAALLNSQMNKKEQETEALKQDIQEQIVLAEVDNERIKSRANDYSGLVEEITEQNEKEADATQSRNEIPDLLNQLMYIIPEDARIGEIENTKDKHIVITAQAVRYEQLGYLKAKIKSEGILTNVTSSGGDKSDGIITIKIEGDLP